MHSRSLPPEYCGGSDRRDKEPDFSATSLSNRSNSQPSIDWLQRWSE